MRRRLTDRAATSVVSARLGPIAADLILPGSHIDGTDWQGFVLAVLIFAVIQSVHAPWVSRSRAGTLRAD